MLSSTPALRLLELQRDQRQIRAQDGFSASSVNKRQASPCQQDGVDDGDGDSQAKQIMAGSIPDLPEDIWSHIHSLMPLRDAARAACLSRAFLHSWRCYPNLTLNKDVIRPKARAFKVNFRDTIDRILRSHDSSAGVKILKLRLYGIIITYECLDSWLRAAITPKIEELTVVLCSAFKMKYNFPCSVLSNGIGNSLRYLELGVCSFRPTAQLGPMRSLTSLSLVCVRITGDELECLLSNSLALEKLRINNCDEIVSLRIPSVLQQLRYLRAYGCWRLREIESKAPNLSSLHFNGNVELSFGETLLQMKSISMMRSKVVYYARAELPSIMPNLETLSLDSGNEVANTPMLPTKFLYLKHLIISFTSGGSFSPSYNYFSLVSFLDASPSLETLIFFLRKLEGASPYR